MTLVRALTIGISLALFSAGCSSLPVKGSNVHTPASTVTLPPPDLAAQYVENYFDRYRVYLLGVAFLLWTWLMVRCAYYSGKPKDLTRGDRVKEDALLSLAIDTLTDLHKQFQRKGKSKVIKLWRRG